LGLGCGGGADLLPLPKKPVSQLGLATSSTSASDLVGCATDAAAAAWSVQTARHLSVQ
jgi:hypothetical protein